jgi:two-component system, chemotaxis family, response regulator Rcp1
MFKQNSDRLEILLVEDNPGDVRLIVETLKDGRKDYGINVAKDGDQAMAFLKHTGEFAQSPKPDIILLDLKLPGKSGLEVLKEVKQNETLKSIPIIVLTSSSADEDMAAAYKNHANCYITKPISLDKFIVTIQSIEDFWFTIIKKQK